MNGAEVLVPITLFVSIAAIFILRGPLGRAMADRLAGRHQPGPELEDMREELLELRDRLAEAEERLDFNERLLSRGAPDNPPRT